MKNIIDRLINTKLGLDTLSLRLGAGVIFTAHGAQKLFGWFGGLFLIFGLLVRPSAFVLAITMLVAIFAVHVQNGLFMSNSGYEFGLALLVISISLIFRGAGSLSLDNLFQNKMAKQ